MIKLLPPELNNSFMQALKERKSSTEFSSKELSLQILSNLLWSAFGINRETGGRTAPSSKNLQEISIYVSKADGLYLFDAKEELLIPILKEDIREITGPQSFVKDAPINLIYVADLSKLEGVFNNGIDLAVVDVGFISQNVYLFCAAFGLATVVRAWVNIPKLSKAMKLQPNQRIILAQTVGYPK